MKNKLKIYSVLLVVVLVASVCKYLNVYSYSWTNRPGEELIVDSLNENFAKIDINTHTWTDTIDGAPVTQSATNSHTRGKFTYSIGVPVRKRGSLDHYLYSRLTNGQQVMVDMQTVKIKIPIEESQKNTPFLFSGVLALAFVPFYIWLFVIVWKILRSVYKGEVFVTQIAKGLEKAGKLLVALWIVGRIVSYVILSIMKENLLMAGYDIDIPIVGELSSVIFGLILMIVSQIILRGKELQDEQELTI
jgi:hypothetical protein